MASSSVIAKRYFDALNKRDLDGAVACWKPGAIERLIGQAELVAPDGVRDYFAELFDAFPDFSFELIDTTTQRDRCSVRWRATARSWAPGASRASSPTVSGSPSRAAMCVRVVDDLIVANTAYVDSGDVARQLGFLPPAGSTAERPADHAREHPYGDRARALRRRAGGDRRRCLAVAWRTSRDR